MSPSFTDMSKTPQSSYIFESGQQFLQFYNPDQLHKTPKRPDEIRKLLRNRAQCEVLIRLNGLTSKRKTHKLETNYEYNWKKITALEPKGGYDSWWKKLKEETNPTVVEKHAICLGNAFENIIMAWRFTQYPSVVKFVFNPSQYRELMIFAIESDSAEDRAARHPIEQGHTSINKTRDDQLGGTTQPLDPQPAREGPANERSNIAGNSSRPNEEESLGVKRVCLRSGEPDIQEVNATALAEHAISSSVFRPDQELRMPISLQQSTGITILHQETSAQEAAASQDRQPLKAKQVLDRSGGILQPRGSLVTVEGPAREGSGVCCHTSVASESGRSDVKRHDPEESRKRKRKCHATVQLDTHGVSDLKPTEGQEPRMFTSPGQPAAVETSAPVEPHPMIHKLILNRQAPTADGLSTEFEYCGQSDRLGTSDVVVEYSWTGFSAVTVAQDGKHLIEDDDVFYYYKLSPSSIERVPFKDLTNSMKRSETWKKQSQDCEGSECFILKLRKLNIPGLYHSIPETACVRCVVPREEAPKRTRY